VLFAPHSTLLLQLAVDPPDESGSRALAIHIRPQDEQEWTQCATAVITAEAATPHSAGAWPPPDAPAAADTPNTPLSREVRLPEDTDAVGHILHPRLLEAALALDPADPGQITTSVGRVTVYAAGATAAHVRLARGEDDALTLMLTDAAAAPVARIESLVRRSPDPAAVRARHQPLRTVDWRETPLPAHPATARALGEDQLGLAWLLDGRAQTVKTLVISCAADPQGRATADAGPVLRVLEAVRGWLADESLAETRLAVVTTGALRIGTESVDPTLAAVMGLARSVRSENPGRAMVIDTDEASLSLLPRALASSESEIVLRQARAYTPHLVSVPQTGQPARPLDPQGTVLITGGLGRIGRSVARHLVSVHGARHLLLAGRRGPRTPGADALVAELSEQGAEVTVAACDIGRRDDVAALLAAVSPKHPLTAVLHAAGCLDDGIVPAIDADRFKTVWQPKAGAAAYLDELTAGLDLRAFVLFSSIAGLAGTAGQANYAAANTFLDGLAAHRHSRGLPATSIAWGLWSGTGEKNAAIRRSTEKGGAAPMEEAEALALLDAALAAPAASVIAARFDFAALQAASHAIAPGLRGLVPLGVPSRAREVPLAQQLAGLGADEKRQKVAGTVRVAIAAVLGRRENAPLSDTAAFRDLGFDSLTSMELRNRLVEVTGMRMPATVAFDHPTFADLTEFVLSELDQRTPAPALAHLDQLEAAMAAEAATDSTLHHEVITRLRRLLASWPQEPSAPASGTAAADDALLTASATEIFAIIDSELSQ
jgi:short-subunit dehydrogenase/acyl carrier protein